MKCKCGASGFEPSRIPGQCEFCDGTFSGNPPSEEEVETELNRLLVESKAKVAAMTPEERHAMYAAQREGWVKSELQWAKDFREGKCERD